ncbi:acyl-CoA dehydrogenase family protein [Cryptosporangium aurantiacum]|uniref:Acyl-CoA dehydrogenase n=1 Tax=Cryptosporangium aurantiacum TaxID=134849 RepID=A0A1M7RLJ2_9ACTN|nr:acyl-CoA dehydrogenase family protein [Cryptosporangium aurantiacum]SHN47050.1 Acyl-CoA dehydrogenase [Cryptosporangium aurantiacum]
MTTDTLGPYRLTDAEQSLLTTVTELATGFAETAADLDERAEIPIENLRALTAAGVERAVLPKDVGGEGVGYQAFGELIRVLAQAEPSTATIFLMHAGAGIALAQLTAPTLGSYYADEFLRGARFANALSEPASGNTFLQPQQVALPTAGGHTLDGAKRFVSGSEIAEHLLVNALVDDVPTFFGVEPDETVETIPIWDTLGLRATRSQLLTFHRTLLREDRRGRGLLPTDFAAIPAGLPSISLGIADAALGALVGHARSRVIQGRPLAHQQWVQFEVAAVESRLEAAKAYTRLALWHADSGLPQTFGSLSRAKLLANRVAVEVAQLGVRIGGASGYLKTSPIQRHLRDAEAGQLMAYSTEVLSGQVGQEILGI